MSLIRNVSQQWKDEQKKNFVSESFVEINIRIADPEAQANAQLSSNGEEMISVQQDVIEETARPVKYATLEPYIWVLDGTYDIIGTDSDEYGYEGFIPKETVRTMRGRDGKKYYVVM